MHFNEGIQVSTGLINAQGIYEWNTQKHEDDFFCGINWISTNQMWVCVHVCMCVLLYSYGEFFLQLIWTDDSKEETDKLHVST